MKRRLIPICLLLCGGLLWLSAIGQQDTKAVSATVSDFSRNWLPSRGAPAGLHYVGAAVCASCHVFEAAELKTPMGEASLLPAQNKVLNHQPRLSARNGADIYRLARLSNGDEIYSVTAGGQTAQATLQWAFGLGYAGQTYLYQAQHIWHESRVSYFKQIHGLDTTIGYSPRPPRNLHAALGRRMGQDEARACFVCHTTGAVRTGQFLPAQATPGVTCEQCHGPGSAHVAAMRAHRYAQPQIFNPAQLSPGRQADFCGNCHRTLMMVMQMGVSGILDVRFQPYRLSLSKCYNPSDARITCLACHDPHHALVKKISWYDDKCLACHIHRGQKTSWQMPGQACPVAQRRCVSCHMPKLALPGAHHLFSDHYIRIVKPGAAYPD